MSIEVLAVLAIVLIIVVINKTISSNKCPKGGRHDDTDAQMVMWLLYEFKCKKCGQTRRIALW